jgi:hypothetical protein
MRNSRDQGKINTYDENLIDLCKMAQLRIINGRLPDDQVGNLTRVESNGKTLVDYVLSDCLSDVMSFKVERKVPESDHCPLSLMIQTNLCKIKSITESESPVFRYVCKGETLVTLPNQLESCKMELEKFYAGLSEKANTNVLANLWNGYVMGAMDKTFPKVQVKKKKVKAPWLDNQCRELRKKVSKCRDDNERIVL